MDIVLICFTAFAASILTFFSGFGLGTLLTPVFMLFFKVDIAIALTGVVHFFNNLLKIFLVGKHADKLVFIQFGIPAIIAAFGGSYLMIHLADPVPVFTYSIGSKIFEVFFLKLMVAILLIIFALMELLPYFKNLQFDKNKLALGGILSGFFGGLSGNQGALRAAFLIKIGLTKEAFIGTAVLVSSCIDFTRLSVYASRFGSSSIQDNLLLVSLSTFSAMAGAWIGNQWLKKVTLQFVQSLVAVLLILVSIALGLGWI